ncbi:MAG TPA: HlyD family secretion protein [Vicinamibacterales bacterium]|nr:HlyD family secretion protein [Vicinamibacterales bacterium]
MSTRVRVIALAVVIVLIGSGIYLWATSGRESTDDAQVDAHVTPIAARVGGTVLSVPVTDNQLVAEGADLVAIDPRDYEIALTRAQAELADARAALAASQAEDSILATTASSNVSSAQGGVSQAESGIAEAEHGVTVARARLSTAQARRREQEANSIKATRDVERLRGLLAKDEIAQQQFDAAVAAAESAKAAVDSATAQVAEAEAAIKAAESRVSQSRTGREQAGAELRTAQTVPQQMAAGRAKVQAATARAALAEAQLKQAELNLQRTTVKAPVAGIVSRKSIEPGQIVQAGQPLMTVIALDRVWITANFKETQLRDMRSGQPVTVDVDAYGGREFTGKIDSIAAATGSRFSLLPPDNATGNFVKVVQRVPVKIVLDQGQDPDHILRPGMSVTPTVHTR